MNHTLAKSKGTALVTALVLLVALTIVSMAGMQSTTVQMQISGNDEATIEAFQYAQSVVDAVVENPANFVVGASDGYTLCAYNEAGCDSATITLGNNLFTTVGVGQQGVQARVELLKVAGAPRMASNASSATAFNGAYFKVSGRYDLTSNDRGKSSVVQGFVMLIPKS